MTTKSYTKHKEYKEFSSRGTVPYDDEQFDMLKSELIPKGSKLDSLGRGTGTREYHYEYKEEKLPGGKYDRKDFHTVEEYTIPPRNAPKSAESSSYYYEKEEREIPAITTGTRTYNYETVGTSPAYTKVNSKVTKEMTQNVEELDSLLDDLQRDQERQLYKSGYASDTAESTSFDYRRGTPARAAPSSGYSTLKREELSQQLFKEEKIETRAAQGAVTSPTAPPCTHCHHQPAPCGTLPMNKVTTTVKTYTYEVPAGADPTTLPLPPLADTHTHACTHACTDVHTATLSRPLEGAPGPGCQYCSHCNCRTREYSRTHLTDETSVSPSPAGAPAPRDGHPPYGSSTYKYSESYSAHNSLSPPPPGGRHPSPSPGPFPRPHTPSSPPAPFPRPHTPSPAEQQPPKRLDDLLADFPEARFPTQPDGVRRRVEANARETRDTSHSHAGPGPTPSSGPTPTPTGKLVAAGASKNVAGPAVYYPPGHTPFAKKEAAGYQASAMQGGGAYASGRGMYEYESGARSKQKHSEKTTAVPVCLPLCCAMPCVIM
ncbi:unnamed protein product, partial [Iphiclides podalirius]